MSGKKRTPSQKKENRGGKRAGAGRKPKAPKEIDTDARAKWVIAAEKIADEKGKTIEYAALKLFFGRKTPPTLKAAILKAYNEATLVKTSDKSVSIKEERIGPVIALPPSKPDPAKLIPIEGGRDVREK